MRRAIVRRVVHLAQAAFYRAPVGEARFWNGRSRGARKPSLLFDLTLMRWFSSCCAVIVLVACLTAPLPAQTSLGITTNSPLPSGTVGERYSQTLQASGGTAPYTWQVVGSVPPPGLALATNSGIISGTPTTVGTFNFQVQVTDSANQTSRKNFSITIDPQSLTINNDSILTRARVGEPYVVQLAASGGIPPYANWRVTEGLLPQGIILTAATGRLTGTPSTFGTFAFTIAVNDSAFETASKRFTLVVDPGALTITTNSLLPLGRVATAYQMTLVASGGPTPFAWSVIGNLPSGLTLNATSGVISGTPTAVGEFEFRVRVTDAGEDTATRDFQLNVADPRATISLDGSSAPGQQPRVKLVLAATHPFAIAGQLVLTFRPDAINNTDDQTVLFSNGTRMVQFTVPENSAEAQFPGGNLLLQTGTTAGVLTLTVTALQTGGQAIPVASDAKLDVTLAQAPPSVTGITIRDRTAAGFAIQLTGFSTPREVTRAVFRFTPISGRTLQNSQVTIDLSGPANTFFASAPSSATGGAFVYTQPFTVQGDLNAIQSVAVTLTNSRGDSQAASANF